MNQPLINSNDYIYIQGLCVRANHGVLPEEKQEGQEFYLDVKLYYDMAKACCTDDLKEALNYADCCHYITYVFTERSYDLIECAADHLCRCLLWHYPELLCVDLVLSKPHAPIGLPFSNVSVRMCRGWHKAYLSIGSNMGDRRSYIEGAVRRLRSHPDIRDVVCSGWVETEPYGYTEQDRFLNGALIVDTIMEPERLLDLLHEIENEAGRRREIHWGPRTLDLDIVFYDKLVYESERLIIPHVDMENRLFVLEPLSEIAPGCRHPLLGKTVAQLRDERRADENRK